jgi:hypothetical protein
MKFKNEAIGARLLETVTSGLYDGNINCLREYVQNGIDSRAKNIEIYFENGNEDLVIRDDGSGMTRGELEKSLYLGVSEKSGDQVGWRGIGVWSGVPSCRRIVIITKKKNSAKLRLEIDNDILRDRYLSNDFVLNVLTNATGEIEEEALGKDESFKNDHYTVVRLESILNTQRRFFDEKEIENYLGRTLPVRFDKKKFSLTDEIEGWLKQKNVKFQEVNVKFKGVPIFRPPTKTDIFHNHVIKKEFELEGKLIAVGWFLMSNKNEKLQKPDAGIYFKKRGFTIGDENLVVRQAKKSYSQWQYGEIHVVSRELRENAARNSFEYNDMVLDEFFDQIGDFLGSLQTLNHYQSNTTADKVIADAEKKLESKEFKSLTAAKKKITKAKEKISKTRSFPEEEKSFKGLKTLIDKKSSKHKKAIAKIKSKIEKDMPAATKEKPLKLDKIKYGLSPAVKKSIDRVSREGKKHTALSVTDSLKDILKQKTGLKTNEIHQLSKAAFGWNHVEKGKDPLLTIDSLLGKDKSKGDNQRRASRNRCFGVMIYAIHDLFVNMGKHDGGKESFKFFEGLSEEKKEELFTELCITIDLLYRLIEETEKYQPQIKDLDIS